MVFSSVLSATANLTVCAFSSNDWVVRYQNAYIESFNGRLRDECLNEHWFPSLLHARSEIERWRREYNEERPKKGLGGITPAAYAKQLL